MKKFTITLIVGIAFLTAASVAQAHSRHYGGFRGAVSIAVPVGHQGFAVLGTAPYYYPARYYSPTRYYSPARHYYPAPYVRRGYVRGYKNGYRHGNRHGKHHDRDNYSYDGGHGRDRRRRH